jgi:hypothetical protein
MIFQQSYKHSYHIKLSLLLSYNHSFPAGSSLFKIIELHPSLHQQSPGWRGTVFRIFFKELKGTLYKNATAESKFESEL